MKPENLNIVFIGAGKIAYSFAGALRSKGINLSAVISRSITSAQGLAAEYDIPLFSDQLCDIPDKSNLIILSVPDGELKQIARNFSKLKINFRKKTFIHLSGSLNTDVLKPLAVKGAKTASLHILQSFPIKTQIPLKGCFAAIETENKLVYTTLKALADRLELIPFRISSESKTLYHIAGVFASNFLAGNIFALDKNIELAGIKPDASSLFRPIIQTTLNNIRLNGPVKALSGPVERNDIKTIERHIKELKKKGDKFSKYIYLSYLAQSLLLIKISEIKKDDPENFKELNNRLVEELHKLVNLM